MRLSIQTVSTCYQEIIYVNVNTSQVLYAFGFEPTRARSAFLPSEKI